MVIFKKLNIIIYKLLFKYSYPCNDLVVLITRLSGQF